MSPLEWGWPALHRTAELPVFPVDALPWQVAQWVEATAEATQTPVDLAACAALGVLSACVAGKAVVEVQAKWTEELVLFLVLGLESGDRKSAVLRAATDPLRRYERELRDESVAAVSEARAEREALGQRQKALTGKAAREEDPDVRRDLTREVGAIAARLASEPEPVVPRLLADDATPEALAGLLAAHGRIAILAAESAFIDNLAGRYSEGRSNLHLVCQSYTGESTTVDRRGRDPESLDRPLVTMALSVQPHVLEAFATDRKAVEQGLVARCIVARPRTLLGIRKSDPTPVPADVSERWDLIVSALASLGSVSCVSTSLRLSASATVLRKRVAEENEPRLQEDGDLRPIASWFNRHVSRAIRIAALLHIAGQDGGEEITVTTFADALRIADWSLAHAQGILTGPSREVRAALDWLERHGEAMVTVRDLQRGPLHSRGTADVALDLARELEAIGALRALTELTEHGPGRPGSPRYEVHPDLVGGERIQQGPWSDHLGEAA